MKEWGLGGGKFLGNHRVGDWISRTRGVTVEYGGRWDTIWMDEWERGGGLGILEGCRSIGVISQLGPVILEGLLHAKCSSGTYRRQRHLSQVPIRRRTSRGFIVGPSIYTTVGLREPVNATRAGQVAGICTRLRPYLRMVGRLGGTAERE
jgi:hypothetical protein